GHHAHGIEEAAESFGAGRDGNGGAGGDDFGATADQGAGDEADADGIAVLVEGVVLQDDVGVALNGEDFAQGRTGVAVEGDFDDEAANANDVAGNAGDRFGCGGGRGGFGGRR